MSHHLERPAAYEAYLDALTADPVGDGPPPERAGAGPDVADAVTRRLEEITDDLVALSHTVHANPELGFAEHHAAAAVAGAVAGKGIDIEVGVFGLDTAFRAVAGSGDGPRIAIISEYDALPGIGHGCGHNVICAAGVGAFLAVAPLAAQLGGTVELIGTPAEEGGSGKEVIARAGGFDGIDCAMMVHPASADAGACTYLGMRQVDVTFHGLGAHASAYPFMGFNALDACVSAYTMIGQLRQHMLSSDRIHGIITYGGDKPNIVPERASASYYVRSERIDTLMQLTDRMDAIFHGAAEGTGTTVDIAWDPFPFVLPVRNNLALARRYVRAEGDRGRSPMLESPVPSGSTDMGNVSVRVPSIHPKVAVAPPRCPIHTEEFAAHAGSSTGDAGVVDAAYGLAMTALDYLADADLREDVAAEFAAAGGVVDVEALDR